MVATSRPTVSIVIPAFNEEEQLARSLELIRVELERSEKDFQILVVDDGSVDSTWQVLSQERAADPRISAVRLSRNFGKELAVCAGLESATGEAVIIMDADLQHPPKYLAEMIDLWQGGGVDIVEAVKVKRQNESAIHRVCAPAFYSLMKWLTGYDLANATDFKLLDRKVLDAWFTLKERNIFFRGMVAWLGFNRKVITVEISDREAGESSWSYRSLFRLGINAIVSFSSLPLRIIFVLGALFLVVAILMGLRSLQLWFTGGAASGITTVILLQLFIGGILLTSLGVIGKYISMIYDEVKGRPRYLIAERLE